MTDFKHIFFRKINVLSDNWKNNRHHIIMIIMIILFQGLGQKNIYPNNNNLTTRYDNF